jgi:hypothetical protein
MIRVTFEILPGGDAGRARVIGLMEIANLATNPDGTASYAVVMKKTPPFTGALRAAWRKGRVAAASDRLDQVIAGEDDELLAALVTGHHRTRRGVYDLLYRAMRACGLHERNPGAVDG